MNNQVAGVGVIVGAFTNEGAGGENYNTIYYIAESPHEEGVIYTGTDGGMMQISKDGGQTWEGRNQGLIAEYLPNPSQCLDATASL